MTVDKEIQSQGLANLEIPNFSPSSSLPTKILEKGLSQYLGRTVQIVESKSTPLYTFSTHPIERLEVTLDDSQQFSVIFKQLQPTTDLHIRSCGQEVCLYKRLLCGQNLGAPALYASLHDEINGYYWLFLEDVGECKLEYCDVDDWLTAFRWLARMHATYYSQDRELRALNCLSEHGARFYRYLAQMARQSIQQNQPRAIAHFDQLMMRLDNLIAYLDRQPHTLVHGDMSCHNLIVQPGVGIRPIDWEWAAIGVPAWDVAKLLSGWGLEKPRLLAAYLDELTSHLSVPFDQRAFYRTLACCEILKTLWYLRWWIKPCQDSDFTENLLDKIADRWHWLEQEQNYG